jgi:UDP-N-acetylglucosamine 2-epimerase (non-hydrolysing)
MRTILTIIGTRPEVIKMSPVLRLLRKERLLNSEICATSQQGSLLPQSLSHFHIEPDYSLAPVSDKNGLFDRMTHMVAGLRSVLSESRPDLVLVQGDTTSALAGAIAAHAANIPIGHVEAGLRTGDLSAPFPEEMNRQLISQLAQYHFATTRIARDNLLGEGVGEKNIWTTGSTAIDALLHALYSIKNRPSSTWLESIPGPLFRRISDQRGPLILVTGHRRENHGTALTSVCRSISTISERHPDWNIVFPLHPNPAARQPACSVLRDKSNVYLVSPMNYTEFVFAMSNASLIVTDSGGIQEEAPYLKVPLLVTRDCTERIEGVSAGVAHIVGSHPDRLTESAEEIVLGKDSRSIADKYSDLYGDGRASSRIVSALAGPVLRVHQDTSVVPDKQRLQCVHPL